MRIENNTLLEVNNQDIVDRTVIIPDDVTAIGCSAFEYYYDLKSITIPDNVKSIGAFAFHRCINLTNIIIGNNVTSIGEWAFYDCKRLKSRKLNYKAFELRNNELYCRNKRYIEDVENSVTGELRLCENGIHYCTNLFEIFNYYYGEIDKDIAIYEIEVGDKVLTSDTSKCCTNSCILKRRLYQEDIIKILNGEEV